MDNVIVGILPPPIFNTINTQNTVQLYKPFETPQVLNPRNCENNFLRFDSGSDMLFDKIVSIKTYEPQHVYDLEIENTHNFIANDIVAYNTYVYQNASFKDNLTIGGNVLYVDTSASKVGMYITLDLYKSLSILFLLKDEMLTFCLF